MSTRANQQLHLAADGGDLKGVTQWIYAGANPNYTNNQGCTALYYAAERGHTAVVEKLLTIPTINVNAVTVAGATPLIIATQNGYIDIVDNLLKVGAKIDVAMSNGVTALYMAANQGHVAIVGKLIAAGATLECVFDGFTPLAVAVARNYGTIVEMLLVAGANTGGAPQNGKLPLCSAAVKGDIVVVEKLLKYGANPNSVSKDNMTPLLHAILMNNTAIVDMLLAAGANGECAHTSGMSALMLAVKMGNLVIVEKLIAAGVNLDRVMNEGGSALTIAAEKHQEKIARVLIEAGADRSICNHKGETAFGVFFRNGRIETALYVQKYKPTPEAFLRAVERGNVDSVRRLMKPEFLSHHGEHGCTPLHLAAKHGSTKVIHLLIEHGADVLVRDDLGWTPLHVACANGSTDAITALVDKGAKPASIDHRGLSCVHVAARYGQFEAVRVLVNRGVTLTTAAEDDRTILHCGVHGRNPQLVKYLLEQGQWKVNAMDVRGYSPLHYAVRSLEKLPEFERTNGRNVSLRPLSAATEEMENRHALVRMLLTVDGVNVNAIDHKGVSPLLVASEQGDAETVQLLLDHGARADAVDVSRRSPLTVAASADIRSVVQLYRNSQHFHDKAFVLLNKPQVNPTIAQLMELSTLITSVYDLRLLFTLVSMSDDVDSDEANASRHQLVKGWFSHLVTKKLTIDDDACVFFKVMLEYCEQEGLLPRNDILLLDRQAEKVNTESATWVQELKKQVHTNSWRLDAHDEYLQAVVKGLKEVHAMVMENRKAVVDVSRRVGGLQKQVVDSKKLLLELREAVGDATNEVDRFESRLSSSEKNIQTVANSLRDFRQAYVDRLRQQERNEKIKRVCGIVASVAGFVFAPVLKEVASAVVDFVNPIEIVEKVYGEVDIARFVSEGTDKVLPKVIQEQLEKYAIPKDEFETLLREEIVLQHPEYVDECKKRCLTLNVDGGQSEVARSVEPVLDTEEATLSQLVCELQAALKEATSTPRSSTPPPRLPAGTNPNGATTSPHSPPRSPARHHDTRADDVSTSPPSTPRVSTIAGVEPTVVFVDNLETFQFHLAVHECHGDVTPLLECMEMIDTSACDPATTMNMELSTETKSCKALCAAEYAYCRGFLEVGDMLTSRMTKPPVFDKTHAKSIHILGNLEAFPYIQAVEESQGDVEECEEFVEFVDEQKHSLDDTIEVEIDCETKQTVQWTAVEYACHLGYVDVVKYLLKEVYKDTFSMKTKFNMLRFAREQSMLLGTSRNLTTSA